MGKVYSKPEVEKEIKLSDTRDIVARKSHKILHNDSFHSAEDVSQFIEIIDSKREQLARDAKKIKDTRCEIDNILRESVGEVNLNDCINLIKKYASMVDQYKRDAKQLKNVTESVYCKLNEASECPTGTMDDTSSTHVKRLCNDKNVILNHMFKFKITQADRRLKQAAASEVEDSASETSNSADKPSSSKPGM